MNEADAQRVGLLAGYRSMRTGKRRSWNEDDAAASFVAYLEAAGKPPKTIDAAKAALTGLTNGAGSSKHNSRSQTRSKRK